MARNFTPSMLDSLPVGATLTDYFDAREAGLVLRVSPQGAKVFRFRARSLGKVVTLGPYSPSPKAGHTTLSQARDWVEALKAARKGGPDAFAEVEAKIRAAVAPAPTAATSSGPTVDEVATALWKVLQVQRKRGESEARPIYERHIKPTLGALPFVEVRRSHCSAVVQRAVDGGAVVHAGKVLGLLKQLLDFAERRFAEDDWSNPAARLQAKDFGVLGQTRKRWLDRKEIRAFWRALSDRGGFERNERVHGQVGAALRLLLLTAARTGELRLAEWSHVNLKAKTWTIPVAHQKLTPKHAKEAADFVVPLTPGALEQFTRLKELAEGSRLVLPSPTDPEQVWDDKSIARAMRRLWCGEEGRGRDAHPALSKLEAATPHDLRRTARTWLGKLDVEPHIAERCLNHRLGKIVATYDRFDYLDKRREALSRWDAHVSEIVG